MAMQAAVVIVLARSAVYIFVFILAVMVTYLFKLILVKLPAVPRWYWWVNTLLCLGYPQIGLHLVAWQVEDRQERQLGILLAFMKFPSLVALTFVIGECAFRIFTPGVMSVLLPGPTYESFAIIAIPLMNMYVVQRDELDEVKENRRAIVLGLLSAGLVSYGIEEYWLVGSILAAIIPIRVFKYTTDLDSPVEETKEA